MKTAMAASTRMRTKKFDRCIKNEMEEDLKKIREEVTECKTDIVDNTQNIAGNKQNIAEIVVNPTTI
jgi:hypothetical protein